MKLHPGFRMGPGSREQCLSKRMAEGGCRHTVQRRGRAQEEAEAGGCRLKPESTRAPGGRQRQGRILSWSLGRELSPADTRRAPGLQNYERKVPVVLGHPV